VTHAWQEIQANGLGLTPLAGRVRSKFTQFVPAVLRISALHVQYKA
jgi:hypothetical protein